MKKATTTQQSSSCKQQGFRISTGVRAGHMLSHMYYSIPRSLRSFS